MENWKHVSYFKTNTIFKKKGKEDTAETNTASPVFASSKILNKALAGLMSPHCQQITVKIVSKM